MGNLLEMDDDAGQGGGDQGGQNEGGQGGGDQGGQNDSGQGGGDQGGGNQPERVITGPDGEKIALPVNLWDAKANGGKGGPNVAALAKSALDLRKQLGMVPGKYEVKLGGDLADKFEIAQDDPFATEVVGILSESKGVVSQATFEKLATAFAKRELARETADTEAETTRLTNDNNALSEAWGQNAGSNVKALDGFLKETFKGNEAALEEIRLTRASAAGTMMLWTLFEAARGKGLGKPGGGGGGEILTESDLDKLQKSVAYQNENHPDYAATRKKVRDGYKRLYPDGQ